MLQTSFFQLKLNRFHGMKYLIRLQFVSNLLRLDENSFQLIQSKVRLLHQFICKEND
jgi:hypothetical protein